jgi:glycosyltransferase involved in cell wall biosynthesis
MSENGSAQPVHVSVVVPCRNEAKHIRAFLQSLWKQDVTGIDLEVLLADGMSTDGTREVVAEYQASHGDRLRIIDNPQLIVSTALNLAIRAASGDIVVRMDCHTEYAPDYIVQCVRALRQTDAQNVGGPACTKAEGWMARAIEAAYHSRFSTGGARFHDEHFEGYVDTVTYGCWHKATLERLGLFDELLVRNQDDELNLRLIRSGGKVWQSPAIVSWYRPRGKLSALFRQYFQYGFWKVPIIRKYRIPGSWRHLVPGPFVLSMVLLMVLSIVGLLAGVRELTSIASRYFLIEAVVYGSAIMIASVATARRCGWTLLPILPAVFFVYHASYGLGFLGGIVYWSLGATRTAPMTGALTGLSR